MRSAGNFHPEWGYLLPTHGFMRALRIALVSTAIGATSGAVVVISLVERLGSSDDNRSLSAHALVTEAQVIRAPAETSLPAANTKGAAPLSSLAAAASVIASLPEPGGPPSSPIARAPDDPAEAGGAPPAVETHHKAHTPSAKVTETKKEPLRRRYSQFAATGRTYRHYDRQFGRDRQFAPSFQTPDNRPFVQLGFGGFRNEW